MEMNFYEDQTDLRESFLSVVHEEDILQEYLDQGPLTDRDMMNMQMHQQSLQGNRMPSMKYDHGDAQEEYKGFMTNSETSGSRGNPAGSLTGETMDLKGDHAMDEGNAMSSFNRDGSYNPTVKKRKNSETDKTNIRSSQLKEKDVSNFRSDSLPVPYKGMEHVFAPAETKAADPSIPQKAEDILNQLKKQAHFVYAPEKNGGMSASELASLSADGNLESEFSSSLHLGTKGPDNRRVKRLERNRQSAKKSRQRKKEYLQLLEEKVRSLLQDLDTEKRRNNNPESGTLGLREPQILSKVQENRQVLIQKLAKVLENPAADPLEINSLLDSLRLRSAATGSERREAVTYLFDEIVNLTVPTHMRFMMYASINNFEPFNGAGSTGTEMSESEPGADDDSEVSSKPNKVKGKKAAAPTKVERVLRALQHDVAWTEDQQDSLAEVSEDFIEEQKKFQNLFDELRRVQKKLLKQSSSLQSSVDQLREKMDPNQVAKFLLWIDREKDNMNDITAESLWSKKRQRKSAKP